MKKGHLKEKRKITVGLIFCWIFGILFFLIGLGLLVQSAYFSGIIVIIGSLLLIHYFEKLISDKLNFEFSTGVRWLIVIVILIVFFIGASVDNDSLANGASSETATPDGEMVPETAKQITYLSKSYDDLELIFGSGSKYTDLQKESLFDKDYKGQYVKWKGEVVEIDTTFWALTLAVKQKEKQFSFIDEDVTVYMDDSQKNNLLKLNKGQMVTYSGRLNRFSSAHLYLNDGKIIS